MKRVRVLVANRPRVMRDLVLAVIADQPDIEVIGEVQDESELAETVEEAQPDVLIVALDDADKQIVQCGFLLSRYPQMNGIRDSFIGRLWTFAPSRWRVPRRES